jgi:hypothetical protein
MVSVTLEPSKFLQYKYLECFEIKIEGFEFSRLLLKEYQVIQGIRESQTGEGLISQLTYRNNWK